MHIIKSGSQVQIYNGEDIETFTKLPAKTYMVGFHPMRGFYLSIISNMEVKEKKIYGNTIAKITKTFVSYEASNRNFGIILSGVKGAGKTLFVQKLSELCLSHDLPIIIVDSYYNGLADFIESIEQEVVVIFDEFDKNFSKTSDEGNRSSVPQEELLTLFDGINTGKKLFVITCNETYSINNYLLNRPGRFHYHFELNGLQSEEIKEYLEDNLRTEYKYLIPEIIGALFPITITYDILRAIVFELNQGYDLEETLQDLNITNSSTITVNAVARTDTGSVYKKEAFTIRLDEDEIAFELRKERSRYDVLELTIPREELQFKNDKIIIPLDKCDYWFSDDNFLEDGYKNSDSIAKAKIVNLDIDKFFNNTSYFFKGSILTS